MQLPEEVVLALRCPSCGGHLKVRGTELACSREGHRTPWRDGFLSLGEPPEGKYDEAYAARYAALWAFGYQTLRRGLNESLYRTVSSLAAEALAALAPDRPAPLILDSGCGIGRVAADCARLCPPGQVVGLDGSIPMLSLARRVVLGSASVPLDLSPFGFGKLEIPARAASNVFLMHGDVEKLPFQDSSVDVVLSINVVDRVSQGPEAIVAECRRVLRPGGRLILTDPFNWDASVPGVDAADLWARYPDAKALAQLLRRTGFQIDTWFDDLFYRELLDARGSVNEFRTAVFACIAKTDESTRY